MFKLTHPLPERYIVACSGGVDSMAALHFLSRPSNVESGRFQGVIHFNHNTGAFADNSQDLVVEYCVQNGFTFYTNRLMCEKPKDKSPEEWWRDKRYEYFDLIANLRDVDVVLAHHFDDCLEEYLACVLVRGFQGTIPYRRNRCVRPFRLWKKDDIREYAHKNKLNWNEDPTNNDVRYRRNKIRKELVPAVKSINPGIYNIVRKMVVEGS